MKTETRWLLFPRITFFTGVVLGLSSGLLYAPHSGFLTRQKLKNMAEDALERVEDWGDDTKQAMSDMVKRGKNVFGRSVTPS
jgi:gas vesicle protein